MAPQGDFMMLDSTDCLLVLQTRAVLYLQMQEHPVWKIVLLFNENLMTDVKLLFTSYSRMLVYDWEHKLAINERVRRMKPYFHPVQKMLDVEELPTIETTAKALSCSEAIRVKYTREWAMHMSDEQLYAMWDKLAGYHTGSWSFLRLADLQDAIALKVCRKYWPPGDVLNMVLGDMYRAVFHWKPMAHAVFLEMKNRPLARDV
jgi:hypothetical protein